MEQMLRDIGVHPEQIRDWFNEAFVPWIKKNAPGVLEFLDTLFVTPLEEALSDYDVHPKQLAPEFERAYKDDESCND